MLGFLDKAASAANKIVTTAGDAVTLVADTAGEAANALADTANDTLHIDEMQQENVELNVDELSVLCGGLIHPRRWAGMLEPLKMHLEAFPEALTKLCKDRKRVAAIGKFDEEK